MPCMILVKGTQRLSAIRLDLLPKITGSVILVIVFPYSGSMDMLAQESHQLRLIPANGSNRGQLAAGLLFSRGFVVHRGLETWF